jgi:hypothetical protein
MGREDVLATRDRERSSAPLRHYVLFPLKMSASRLSAARRDLFWVIVLFRLHVGTLSSETRRPLRTIRQ